MEGLQKYATTYGTKYIASISVATQWNDWKQYKMSYSIIKTFLSLMLIAMNGKSAESCRD